MRDSQLYNVHTTRNQYAIRIQFNRDQRSHHIQLQANDFAKAFHTDCLTHLIEQYGLFMLYLSHKQTYSEYTANTKVHVYHSLTIKQ